MSPQASGRSGAYPSSSAEVPGPTSSGSQVAPTPLSSIVPVPTSQFAPPSVPPAHYTSSLGRALQKALSGVRTKNAFPGMQAAIVFPDGHVWSGSSGAAITGKKSVTATTLFAAGSVSKMFVAALIGRLSMAGTIGLDDPLSKYVPSFPNAANITIRELLNHTSGIQDLFENLGKAIESNPSKTWTAQQVLARIGPPWFTPGNGYHYSNTDFILLGMVIEQVTGQTVAALTRTWFLQPLGLTHTYLQTEEQVKGNEAHGYMPATLPATAPTDNWDGVMLPYTSEATAVGVSGAYVSTATDLALWANALYDGDILDQATLASMVDITPTLQFKSPYHGLGFEEMSIDNQVAWGHQGHLDGFWSAVEYFPASHVTIVVLTNAEWAKNSIIPAVASLAAIAIG
jgi:D-alanyl-D-alanine carboxypeptidase